MTDTGDADPRLARALEDPDARAELLAAFVDARVFAAITAASTAEHVDTGTGLRAESSAEMAVVLIEASDGTRALPVFQDLQALKRWRLDARPVPLTGAQACAAALEERASAVLLDPAGAAVSVVELETLKAGWVPVQGTGLSARNAVTELQPPTHVPEGLAGALERALAPERLRAARLLEGPDGLVLGVCPRQPLSPPELAALAQRLVTRLGADLPARGLDLAQVPPKGSGHEIRAARRGLRPGRRG